MENDPISRARNRLLALLPEAEHKLLLRHSEPIRLPRGRILYEVGQTMQNAYFFQSGMASIVAVAENGRPVQIAIVGTEGFVGTPILFSGTKSTVRVVTQTAIDGTMIKTEVLLNRFNRKSQLHENLLRYSQLLQTQIVQSALCNSLHNIRQRLGRWLLVCSDATQSEEFDLTQEDLANMLGSHRNQISAEARELGRKGLIRYARGSITLVDRAGLEHTSCECYRVVRQWERELLNI